MTDQIYAREISPGHWQWASCGSDGRWRDDAYQSGDSEALAQGMPANTPVNVVLRGQSVVATEVSIDAKQRKHAAKLIPFELEDDISAGVDELHFSFAHGDGDTTSVLYADEQQCVEAINDIAEQGCDVSTALPDYLLLQREQNQVVMLLEAAILTVRLSEHWGFSVEQELAPVVIARLAEQSALRDDPPTSVKLIANSEVELDSLRAIVPESWQAIPLLTELGGFWDSVDTKAGPTALNLRRGALSRQLPFAKWWAFWKFPSIVFAVAFICAIFVNVAAFLGAKSEEKTIREDINAVYLQAVPNGRLGDVEGILESKLKSVRVASSEPSNFSYLLSKTVEALGEDSGITITSFSYNGDQRALQLTLEFSSLNLLTEMRSRLSNAGVESDSPRTSSLGDGYQARIKFREQG